VSGFAGMISTDGATPDGSLLERMVSDLAFRGPDGTQIALLPGAGFCFTFLRTGPAPQSSRQPCSLDGRVWLIGDIRLDAREDLRRQIEQGGESVPTDTTDEELVLRLWNQRGEPSFADLPGDFAFALWDSTARRLLCVRDLMGLRPFYYSHIGGHLYFSNTLDVLRLAPGISSTLDPSFIGDFLLQEWCSDAARTVYRDIRRLPPGHTLDYANGRMQLRRYIALPIEEPLSLGRGEEYVEQFRFLLEQAVRDRLPAGPAAIFLSGGLDSTSVAAIAVANGKNSVPPLDLRAYTMDCRPLFEDEEGHYASVAAQSLGIPIEILSSASWLPYAGWDDSQLRAPEPFHDPFVALSRLQYRHVAARARVAFSGYGGDDVLAGQAWPHFVYLLRRRRVSAIAGAFGGYILKQGRIPPLRGGFRTKLRRWTGRAKPFTGYPRWLNSQFATEQSLRERWLELQQSPQPSHPLHPIAYSGLTSDVWSNVFETEDAAWTGVAVESRAPLLDRRVLRYLLQMPPVPWCMEKELLRRATIDLLPTNIRRRPKTPLLGDALKILAEGGRWNPLPLPPPTAEVTTYVDWKQLGATLAEPAGSSLWDNLRAVSLNRWLKGIENEVRIR
jgi:asparagine synthase (glutamine-hydrolysing)